MPTFQCKAWAKSIQEVWCTSEFGWPESSAERIILHRLLMIERSAAAPPNSPLIWNIPVDASDIALTVLLVPVFTDSLVGHVHWT